MACRVVRSSACIRDLELIFDHLVESYISFGDDPEEAFDRAEARIHSMENFLETLGEMPKRGTLRPELGTGIRTITKDKAIYYFTVHDEIGEVRILAIFFGGQDHQRHMLTRLLLPDGGSGQV